MLLFRFRLNVSTLSKGGIGVGWGGIGADAMEIDRLHGGGGGTLAEGDAEGACGGFKRCGIT